MCDVPLQLETRSEILKVSHNNKIRHNNNKQEAALLKVDLINELSFYLVNIGAVRKSERKLLKGNFRFIRLKRRCRLIISGDTFEATKQQQQ